MQAFVGIDIARGSLRKEVEERFAHVRAEPAEDGKPIVLNECLARAEEVTTNLTGGAEARIRYLPDRSQVPRAITNRGAILWFALPDQPAYVYRVTPRRRPNTELHLSLGDPQVTGQELRHENQLRAAFLFLLGMGAGYSGLFNASAAGVAELFHFQFFGVPLPLWTELERGRVSVTDKYSQLGQASEGQLAGWPIQAPVFESENPDELATSVWAYDQKVRSESEYITDLLFNHGQDGILRVVAVKRQKDRSHPQSFYRPDTSAYGDFGGLELSGLIVNITDAVAFQAFANNRSLAATRIETALRDVTQ